MKTYQVRWIPLKCEKMGTRRKHEILFPKIPIPLLEKIISCTGRICKFIVGRNGCLIWTRPRPLSSVSGKIPPIPDLSCFVSSAHCASESHRSCRSCRPTCPRHLLWHPPEIHPLRPLPKWFRPQECHLHSRTLASQRLWLDWLWAWSRNLSHERELMAVAWEYL